MSPPAGTGLAPGRRALGEFEERFRAVLEAVSDGVIVIDEDSVIQYANPAISATFGYPLEALVGGELTMLIPPELRERHRRGIQHYLETGERRIPWKGVELPGLHQSGRRFTVEVSFGVFEEQGQRYFAGVIRDVHTRKEAERRRQAEHAVSRVLADATSEEDPIQASLATICQSLGWEFGAYWSVRDDNEELELETVFHVAAFRTKRALLEASRKAGFPPGVGLPGRVWSTRNPQWIRSVSQDANFPRAKAAAQDGYCSGFGFPIRDENELWGVMEFYTDQLVESDSPLLDTMENIGRQIGQWLSRRRAERERDVLLGEARQAQAAAERATAARDQILAFVSHDLGNTLNLLGLNVEVLQQAAVGQLQKGDCDRFDRIRQMIGDMGRMVGDLLDVSRIEADQLRLELVGVDPATIVAETVEPLRPLNTGVSIEANVPAGLPSVRAEPRRLRQILGNLLQNAVKFTPPGGTIDVEVEAANQGVIFAVRDSGPGISEEDRSRIFERFWHAGPKKGGGSGLGLAIAKGLVELHGGEIWVDSEPGRGSCFRFRLPSTSQ